MAEQFGEAEVVLRGRLDTLQRDLDQAERMVAIQTDRIAETQRITLQQIHASAGQGSAARDAEDTGGAFSSLRTIIVATIGPARLLGGTFKTIGAFLSAIPALAAAASVAVIGVATGGIVLLGAAMGTLADKALQAEDAIYRVIDAAKRFDGTDAAAGEFSDALRDVPIIGKAAETAWALAGDKLNYVVSAISPLAGLIGKVGGFTIPTASAEQQLAAWTGLVAKVEDGRVEVGLFGRALNGLINFSGPGRLARALGLDLDIVGQIDDINRAIERMQNRAAGQAAILPAARQLDTSSNAGRIALEQQATLSQLDGVERVKAAERFRHENLIRQIDAERAAYNEKVAAEMRQLRESGAARETIAAAEHASARAIEAFEEQRRSRLAASLILRQEAVRLAEAEAAAVRLAAREQRRANNERLDAEFRAARARAARHTSGAEASRLRVEGRDFDAERVELEAARVAELDDVTPDQTRMRASINEYYDARAAEIDARERNEARRQDERNRERLANQVEATKQLQSELQQVELQAAGDRVAAAQEAIRERYRRIIADLVEAGNEEAAAIARQIRDAKIEAAGRDDTVRRQQEAAQVSFSRTAIGGTNAETVLTRQLRIAEEQRELQRKIAKNTERTTARAG